MACKINIDKNGRVTVSEYQELWDKLNDSYGTDQAVAIMSYAVEDEFLGYNIENPNVSQVLRYIDNKLTENASPINKEDKINAINLSVNSDFAVGMVEAFTLDEGYFGYDLEKMQSIFSKEDAMYLYTHKPKAIESLYYKLKQGQSLGNVGTTYDVVKKANPFSMENPDYTIEKLEQQFTGFKTREEIVAYAFENEIDITDEEIDYILNNLSDKKLVTEYNPDGSVKMYNRTEDILLQTLDIKEDFRPILSTLKTLLSLSPTTWIEDIDLVEETLLELEQQGEEVGLDLSALSDVLQDRSLQDTSLFLDSLELFLESIVLGEVQPQDVTIFAEIYDNYFDDYSFDKKAVIEESDYNEIVIDGKTTSEEAFENLGVVQKQGNVYVRVPNLSIEEVIDTIYERIQPTDGITSRAIVAMNEQAIKKDIDTFLARKAEKESNPYSNTETLKRIEGIKWIYNLAPTKETITYPEKDINLDEYETELYKELLEKPHLFEHIGFSNQGIELLTKGQYTTNMLSVELNDFSKLQDYAAVSGNNSLRGVLPDNIVEPSRHMYVNNPHLLDRFQAPFKKPTDNTVVTKSDNAEFINLDNEIYEKVAPNNYVKVAPFSLDYNFNITQPQVEIEDISGYLDNSYPDKRVTKSDTKAIEC